MWQGADNDLRRLVDDELDPVAIDEVLIRCDEAPGAWRALATALLEERELRRAVVGWHDSAPCIAGIDFSGSAGVAADRVAEDVSLTEKTGATNEARRVTAAQRWSLAAMLALLVGGLGFFAGRWTESTGESAAALAESRHRAAADDSLAALNPDDDQVADDQVVDSRSRLEDIAAGSSDDSPGIDSGSQPSDPPYLRDGGPIYVGTSNPISRVSSKTQLDLLKQGVWVEEVPLLEQVEIEGQRYAIPNSRLDLHYVGGIAYQ